MSLEKKGYRVRPGLVVPLSESKTYSAGEYLELSDFELSRHAHQVETEAQFQERIKPSKKIANK